MSKPRGILILLSGGLDSMVNLAEAVVENRDISALFIDYGQAASSREENAAREQAGFYGIDLNKVSLPWYGELLPPALRGTTGPVYGGNKPTPSGDEAVWAPNRNGLLVAIAAAFAEANGIGKIVAGFNAEEALTFPDNSSAFIDAYNELLKLSTKNETTLSSYTTAMDKRVIVKRAIELNAPLDIIYSCYTAGPKMCAVCSSCLRLIRAFDGNGVLDGYGDLFVSPE